MRRREIGGGEEALGRDARPPVVPVHKVRDSAATHVLQAGVQRLPPPLRLPVRRLLVLELMRASEAGG
jgi:hypothetical protein